MKNFQKIQADKRQRRHQRTRSKIFGNFEKPRLAVYRSLKHIYAQIIDDEHGQTLVAASDLELTKKKSGKVKAAHQKTELAKAVGKLIARKALDKKITKVIFDRGASQYQGRIQALADAARAEGLKF